MPLVTLPVNQSLNIGLPAIRFAAGLVEQINMLNNTDFTIDLRYDQYINPMIAPIFVAMKDIGTENGNNHRGFNIREDHEKTMRFLFGTGLVDMLQFQQKEFLVQKYHRIAQGGSKVRILHNLDPESYDHVVELLDKTPLNMTTALRNKLKSRFLEIYSNTFEHSKSPFGAYVCAATDPRGDFVFSLYDAGVGIVKNVRDYLGFPQYPAKKAMEWALGDANSTLNTEDRDYIRGAGMGIIQSLVKVNDGVLIIASGDVHVRITRNNITKTDLKPALRGTLYVVKIKRDDSTWYMLREE